MEPDIPTSSPDTLGGNPNMWTPSRFAGLTVIAALLLGAASAPAKPTPVQKCQGGKNQAAGKYAACRQNAEAKLATTGDTVKYNAALDKCELKFRSTWQKLEASAAKAGATCLDGAPSASAFDGVIGSCTNNVAGALRGEALPPGGTLLETNQTTCYDLADNTPKSCAGTGQDGELRKGLARSYSDNGKTITDNQTGLTWEKLTDDGSVHDKDNAYTWADAFATKVQELNTAPCFADHCDWRLPNVNELHSILDYAHSNPQVDAVFNMTCAPSCTATDCSCTAADLYWSSTTDTLSDSAWKVGFDLGFVVADGKAFLGFVRAVRGGA